MSADIQPAGIEHEGRCCQACRDDVQADDVIRVDYDGDVDSDGIAYGIVQVWHYPICPPENKEN